MDRILQIAFELVERTQKPLYLYILPCLNKHFQCIQLRRVKKALKGTDLL